MDSTPREGVRLFNAGVCSLLRAALVDAGDLFFGFIAEKSTRHSGPALRPGDHRRGDLRSAAQVCAAQLPSPVRWRVDLVPESQGIQRSGLGSRGRAGAD